MNHADFLNEITTSESDGRFAAMRIYADWLEDRGDATCEGWRVMAELRKWPSYYGPSALDSGWDWFLANSGHRLGREPNLSRHVWMNLESRVPAGWSSTKTNPNLQDALTDAAQAFTRAIADGWRPTVKYESKIELPPFKIEPLPPPADIEAAAKKAQDQITKQILGAYHVPRNILYGETE